MSSLFKIEKFDLLFSLYIFCILVSELMGGKTFFITNIGSFPLNASVAIFTIPIIFSVNDIIIEVFGIERARSMVRAGLLMVVLLVLFSALAVALPSSKRFLASEPAYEIIFGTTVRISLASLAAFGLSEFTDIFIFKRIREKMGQKALWFRNNISNFISEFIDGAVFIFLAFYAIDKPLSDNLPFLFGIIIPYWLLRCLMSILETPLVYAGVKWLKSEK